ncbi:MAG: acetyltransferase [Syntrophales bacterium]|nr:acetyltransferase [Syntrophales bacterium]
MNLPVIIIGAGGHAKVLISTLKAIQADIIGLTDVAFDQSDIALRDLPVLGNDDKVLAYAPDRVTLVNGIGAVSSTAKRLNIYEKFKKHGYSFLTVIHPSAIIMDDVSLAEGVQVLAGAVIQTGCAVGINAIINTGAIVDHDSMIGEHVHIAPGVVLSGGVHVGTMAHIGTAATVIQGIRIGEAAIIGAGAVVIKDIPAGATAFGVPARVREGKK